MKAIVAASALIMLSAPVAAQDMPGTTMLKASDPATIARYLNQIGYRAKLGKDKAGDPTIETGISGRNVWIYFYGCEKGANCTSLQFQMGISTKQKLSLSQVNRFNQKFRFSQLSLDDEQDPWLYYDLPSGAAGISGDAFELAVDIYSDQINELDRLIDAAETPKK
ncbi:MAG: hypothetical protein DI568_04760 [Sphingomonas sp.]|nr:MAG: hypothetical protein DI568_04760 [Sphingomonas sp.]